MDWVRLLLDRLLSWPLVALVGIFAFRTPLKRLLDREFKVGVGKEGVSFAAGGAVTIQAAGPTVSGLADGEGARRLAAADNVGVSPVVLEQQELIRGDLERLGVSEAEQIRLLIKSLAVAQLHARAEFIYRTIFGSQIALLKFLNTNGSSETTAIRPFYEKAKANFPDLFATYSFDQYLYYMVSGVQLITQEAPDRYAITLAGKEFLKWMADTGLTEFKPA